MAKDSVPSPHPLTPPRSDQEWLAWFRLLRSRRVGPATFHRLIGEHGCAEAALEALPGIAQAAGVEDYTVCPLPVVAAELRAGRLAGATPLAFGAPGYPAALMDLPDAPPVLWAIGDAGLVRRPMIALVGARNASSLGTRMARRLADGLAEAGFAVVSGLARGIDTAAHLGALEGGTIAVMAGGVDVIYPAENAVLAQEIAEKGLRLSEQPMGMQPQARHFPVRNRIVSGLARAVIVVEAAAKSGSLITARSALDQGRDVLAVPGHPFDARATGTNRLIRDGAPLVGSVEDVIETVGPAQAAPEPAARATRRAAPDTPDLPARAPARQKNRAEPRAAPHSTGAHTNGARPDPDPGPDPGPSARANATGRPGHTHLHDLILDRLGPSPLAEDQLIRDLDLSAQEVLAELVTLELDGLVHRQPGGLLSRQT